MFDLVYKVDSGTSRPCDPANVFCFPPDDVVFLLGGQTFPLRRDYSTSWIVYFLVCIASLRLLR